MVILNGFYFTEKKKIYWIIIIVDMPQDRVFWGHLFVAGFNLLAVIHAAWKGPTSGGQKEMSGVLSSSDRDIGYLSQCDRVVPAFSSTAVLDQSRLSTALKDNIAQPITTALP